MYKDELIALLQKHDCKLPVDYKLFGRSFDGIDYRFMVPLKEHYSDDYQKLLDFFPLAELEIMRYHLTGGTYAPK